MNTKLLHSDSGKDTLAFARCYLLILWIVQVAATDLPALAALDIRLFYPQGVMKLLPSTALGWLAQPLGLSVVKYLLLAGLAAALLGIRGARKVLTATAVLLTLYIGLLKGFGGHVNHRELVPLYMVYLLCCFPCYDSWALHPERSGAAQAHYAASMRLLVAVLALNYFFVGAARLFIGFPHVFHPDVMANWIFSRSVRPNPAEFSFGLWLLQQKWSHFVFAVMLPLSTVLELVYPAVFICRGMPRFLLNILMIGFHTGIFLLMGIAFFENIALLFLCFNYTGYLRKFVPQSLVAESYEQ